jgi:hypothetical protein
MVKYEKADDEPLSSDKSIRKCRSDIEEEKYRA